MKKKNRVKKEKEGKNISQNSLLRLTDDLVLNTEKLLYRAKTEEDLRIGFEKLLEPIKDELGIKSIPKFDPENELHQKLSEISKKCYQLKQGSRFDHLTVRRN